MNDYIVAYDIYMAFNIFSIFLQKLYMIILYGLELIWRLCMRCKMGSEYVLHTTAFGTTLKLYSLYYIVHISNLQKSFESI